MAKTVRNLRPHQSEFQKVFSKLCYTQSAWRVWGDFVEMTAIAISNTTELRWDVKQEREERYMNIIGQYTKEEQALFPEMLGILTNALEANPDQDFLGEMFMALELGSHWHGQFFTPYNLCRMMAQVSLADAPAKVEEKGWIAVNDPACGAGATLIGARNELARLHIGGNQVFFVGQDIDRTAGMMCYIQLSLLGCAGYVVIADTLLHPVTGPVLWPNITENQDAWYMPTTFTELPWVLRLSKTWRGAGKEASTCHEKVTAKKVPEVETKIPEVEPALPKIQQEGENAAEMQREEAPAFADTPGGQLSLF